MKIVGVYALRFIVNVDCEKEPRKECVKKALSEIDRFFEKYGLERKYENHIVFVDKPISIMFFEIGYEPKKK